MFINNRLFPYPILNEDTDDYPDSDFSVECEFSEENFHNLNFIFRIHMNDPFIKNMVQSGDAKYAIHAECPMTSYRKIFFSKDTEIELRIDIDDVKEKVEFLALILSSKNIPALYNPKWNEDYEGLTFPIKKGNILGFQNVGTINITKNIEEFNNADSIFNVCSVLDEDFSDVKIDLSGSKIMLQLPKYQYAMYTIWMKSPSTQNLANEMIIFPALIYVLMRMNESQNIYDDYGSREWFIALDKAMKKKGTDLDEQLQTKDTFELAQDIMQAPVYHALIDMNNLTGTKK